MAGLTLQTTGLPLPPHRTPVPGDGGSLPTRASPPRLRPAPRSAGPGWCSPGKRGGHGPLGNAEQVTRSAPLTRKGWSRATRGLAVTTPRACIDGHPFRKTKPRTRRGGGGGLAPAVHSEVTSACCLPTQSSVGMRGCLHQGPHRFFQLDLQAPEVSVGISVGRWDTWG